MTCNLVIKRTRTTLFVCFVAHRPGRREKQSRNLRHSIFLLSDAEHPDLRALSVGVGCGLCPDGLAALGRCVMRVVDGPASMSVADPSLTQPTERLDSCSGAPR